MKVLKSDYEDDVARIGVRVNAGVLLHGDWAFFINLGPTGRRLGSVWARIH